MDTFTSVSLFQLGISLTQPIDQNYNTMVWQILLMKQNIANLHAQRHFKQQGKATPWGKVRFWVRGWVRGRGYCHRKSQWMPPVQWNLDFKNCRRLSKCTMFHCGQPSHAYFPHNRNINSLFRTRINYSSQYMQPPLLRLQQMPVGHQSPWARRTLIGPKSKSRCYGSH